MPDVHIVQTVILSSRITGTLEKSCFHWKNLDIFNILAQNIHFGYMLGTEAVLTSTCNVCFGSRIRKLGIPMQSPVFLYKSGV